MLATYSLYCGLRNKVLVRSTPTRSPSSILYTYSLYQGCIERGSPLVLLLRRAPRDLEIGLSERLLGVGREHSEWGQRITEGTLQVDIEFGHL